MKTITVSEITNAVKQMCITANTVLNEDVHNAIQHYKRSERSPLAVTILSQMEENAKIAQEKEVPICQDTGMAIFFVQIGQEVYIEGGWIEDAIQEGVRQGYQEGYLRKSIVKDPFIRENTKDNTPAVIHYEIVPGDKLSIDFAPKGFGSENMSQIAMLPPSAGIEGAKKFILEVIKKAGPNPCPPIVVGVGIGGNFEKSAILAKKALLRPIGSHHKETHIHAMEVELLQKANELGIGPQGLGGDTTAFGINIETFPTHIAGLPVAVNISCHVTRHGHVEL